MRVVPFCWLILLACGPPPAIQSNDILARDSVADSVSVKHILIGWDGSGSRDPRANSRPRAEADRLATSLLRRVRAGDPIEPLMIEFSEDPGSARGQSYQVTAWSDYVPAFKRLAFRLHPGEAGLVLTEFGWHVMKRVR